MIRDVPGGAVCYTVGTLTRRPLFILKDVESSFVVQPESSAKLSLPLQKVFCQLAVKLVDLFNDNVEVVSARVVHGSAYSNSR